MSRSRFLVALAALAAGVGAVVVAFLLLHGTPGPHCGGKTKLRCGGT